MFWEILQNIQCCQSRHGDISDEWPTSMPGWERPQGAAQKLKEGGISLFPMRPTVPTVSTITCPRWTLLWLDHLCVDVVRYSACRATLHPSYFPSSSLRGMRRIRDDPIGGKQLYLKREEAQCYSQHAAAGEERVMIGVCLLIVDMLLSVTWTRYLDGGESQVTHMRESLLYTSECWIRWLRFRIFACLLTKDFRVA